MKLYAVLIILTTAMLVVIAGGATLGLGFGALMGLVFISHVLLIWTVIEVLKAPVKIDKTFDEYFYLDEDIRRDTPRGS